MKPPTLAYALLFAGPLLAQYPLVNTSPQTIFVLGSLDSGTRYIGPFSPPDSLPGTRTIYHMDLTVDRVLNFPAPPPGMRWANMGYITEALFDTDPSTVEFTMVAMPSGGPGNFASFVFREDGTTLFSQNPGSLTNGPLFLDSYGPIFMTAQGTFMTVHTYGVNLGPVNIYQLPGTLPCMDCHGAPASEGLALSDGAVQSDMASGMTLLPNPAHQEVWVRFERDDRRADAIVLWDASGREVLRTAAAPGPVTRIAVGHLANGRYTVSALRDGGHRGSLPLVVAH
ncbi:MAG: hypothetical protein IT227_05095 [Flavobacteriales bacterium]|nr:hypothetical protein [Flavobacteriales bacterium]